MKMKTLGAFSLAAMLLAANVAMAGELGQYHRDFGGTEEAREAGGVKGHLIGEGTIQGHEIKNEIRFEGEGNVNTGPRGWGWGWGKREIKPIQENMFMVRGEIESVSSSKLVIKTGDNGDWKHPRPLLMMWPERPEGSEVTIKIDSDTVVTIRGEEGEVSDLKAGMHVTVAGDKDGDTLTANRIYVLSEVEKVKGEVTDVDGDEITVTNPKTDESQTIELESDAKVYINGEESDASDIEEGDHVHIKIKSILGDVWSQIVRIFRK